MTSNLKDRVEKALETIRPYLKKDGGNVEVVSIEGKELKLRLLGACSSCEMSHMTMTAGIEEAIKRAVPEIKSVSAVKE